MPIPPDQREHIDLATQDDFEYRFPSALSLVLAAAGLTFAISAGWLTARTAGLVVLLCFGTGALGKVVLELQSREGRATRQWAQPFPIRLSGTIDVLIPAHGPGYLRTPRILGKLESALVHWHVDPRHITKTVDSISFRTGDAHPFRWQFLYWVSSGHFVVDKSGTHTVVHFSLAYWRLAAGVALFLIVVVYDAYKRGHSVGWLPFAVCALFYCGEAGLTYLRFRSRVERLLTGLRPEMPLAEVLSEQLSRRR